MHLHESAIRQRKRKPIFMIDLAVPRDVEAEVRELPDSLEVEVLGSQELNRDGAGVIRFYPDGGASGGYVKLAHENGISY